MKERLTNTAEKRLNPNELISQVAQSFLANNIKYNSISTEGERKASAANVPSIIARGGIFTFNGGKLTLVESKQDGKVTIYGEAGDDIINSSVYGFINSEGSSINELELYGGKGKDNIEGSNAKRNYIVGGVGDDTIIGGESNDTLFGGKDNDILYGSDGSDILTGGLGADIFVLNKNYTGVDTITDFNPGQDKIGFSSGINPSSITSTASEVFIDGKKVANLSNGATVSLADIVEFNVNQRSAQALTDPTDSLNYQAPKNLEPEYSDENRSIFGDGERSASQLALAGNYIAKNVITEQSGINDFNYSPDTLTGGDAVPVERIFGRDGRDILKGGKEDDTIIGPRGVDNVLSGSGANILLIQKEQGVYPAGYSVWNDFSLIESDRLVLEADTNAQINLIPVSTSYTQLNIDGLVLALIKGGIDKNSIDIVTPGSTKRI